MFTIQPSDDAEVSSSPPNLVITLVSQNGILSFAWNPEVAASTSEGRVLIGLPAANLRSVSTASQNRAQILDDFTSLTGITVNHQSNLSAMLVSNNADYSVDVSNQSNVYLQTTSPVRRFQVSAQSTLNVNGDVVTGTVSRQSRLTVTGDISSSVSGTQQCAIEVGTISGQVTISQ